jgi:hypothetical protein
MRDSVLPRSRSGRCTIRCNHAATGATCNGATWRWRCAVVSGACGYPTRRIPPGGGTHALVGWFSAGATQGRASAADPRRHAGGRRHRPALGTRALRDCITLQRGCAGVGRESPHFPCRSMRPAYVPSTTATCPQSPRLAHRIGQRT